MHVDVTYVIHCCFAQCIGRYCELHIIFRMLLDVTMMCAYNPPKCRCDRLEVVVGRCKVQCCDVHSIPCFTATRR